MSLIDIEPKKVKSIGEDVQDRQKILVKQTDQVKDILRDLDSKVVSRSGIASDFSNISSDMSRIGTDIKRLGEFIIKASQDYEQAEKKIEKLVDKYYRDDVFTEQESFIENVKDFFKEASEVLYITMKDTVDMLTKVTDFVVRYTETAFKYVEINIEDLYRQVKTALSVSMAELYSLKWGELPQYIKNVFNRMGDLDFSKISFDKIWTEGYKEFTGIIKDFDLRNLKSLDKFDILGKIFGIVGTVKDVIINIYEAFTDESLSIGKKFAQAFTGSGVDILSGALAGGIGRLIALGVSVLLPPPAGLIMGAGIAFLVDQYVLTDGVKDSIKNTVNEKLNSNSSTSKKKSNTKSIPNNLNQLSYCTI